MNLRLQAITVCSAALSCLALPGVKAAEAAPPAGVLSLSASASVEVTKDVLSVTLGTTREGSDSAGVQSALKQALDAALAEARKAARPGQLEVSTGNFSLYPRYTNKGQMNGWQGSAELIVEGKDMPAIAQLTGRITTLTISRVAYGLSKEQRQKVESDVTAQAIQQFQARAAEYAKQFGYGGASIREVNVSSNEPPVYAAPMARKAMASMSADEALPVEPGKGTVSATVNGSVQMK